MSTGRYREGLGLAKIGSRKLGYLTLISVFSACLMGGQLIVPAVADGSGQTLRILMAGPLTGDFAESGKDIVQGAELAASFINDNGGVAAGPMKGAKLAIEPADDQLSSKAATALGSQYLSDEGIWTMGGFFSSGVALAAAQVAARGKLSVFVSFAGADYLTEKPPHNLLVMLPLISGYARAAFDFSVEHYHAKKVGIIAGDYSFLSSAYPGIDEASKRLGVAVDKQVFPTSGGGTQDFSPYLTNLSHSGVDVILCGAIEGEAARLIKQARQLGLKQPFVDMTGSGFHESFTKIAGDAGIDAISEDSAALFSPPGSLATQMQAAYAQKYGRQMTAPALFGFDTIIAIGAVTAAGTHDRTELLAHATEAHGIGLQGAIGFGADFRPLETVLGFTRITGMGLGDRQVVARYKLLNGGTVERLD